MAEKKFAIRFSVEDMEKVRAALKNMGDDGASALRAIERQSRQATPAMKAVDTAVKDVRAEFDAFANRIPIIGGALAALGPVGTGVAAALGGIVLGFNAMANASRQAVEDISRIKDAADNVGLSAEDFQAVTGAGMLAGIDRNEMEGMLATLAANSARASEGFGRMKAALDRVNPELSKQLATSTTQAERLDILARATQEATSYNDKLNISVAAFGNSGGQMVRMLDETGAKLDDWKAKARDAGLVVQEDLVKAVEAMGDRMAIAEAKVGIAGQRFAVAVAPTLEAWKTFEANAAQNLAVTIEQSLPMAERQVETLIIQWNRLKEEMANPTGRLTINPSEMAGELKRLEDEITRRIGAREREANNRAGTAELQRWFNSQLKANEPESPEALAKREAEAARLAAEAARLRAQQDKESIEIRASLGDWTGKLAAEEARLNALVEAGLLTRETANASLVKTRAELDGSAATLDRWRSIVQATETPVEQATRKLEEFVAEAMKIGDRGPEFQAALRVLSQGLTDAKNAARDATPEFKAVAEAREKITAEADRLMSNQQKLDAYEEKQRSLIGVNGYTWGEATKAIAAYRAELERASQTQRDNTFELRFSAEVLSGIIDENINSLEDLGKVALRVFRQMAIEWILANQKMAASQGVTDFIANAFMSAFGGGGAPAGTGGGSPHATVGVKHSGGIIGSTPVNTRTVNSAMFIGAPRAHTGLETLRAGERPIIAEDGERMLSRVDNARVVRAIEAGAGSAPKVELHFHGAEGKPEVRESRGSDGSIRLDVLMHKAALNALGSADGAKLMSQQYGVSRAVRGG